MTTQSFRSIRQFLSVLLALSSFLYPADAADETWVGTIDGDWTNLNNWANMLLPGAADQATFNNTPTTLTISLDTQSVGNLLFNNASTGAFIIGAGGAKAESFTMGAGGNADGVNVTAAVNAPITVNANIDFNDRGRISNRSAQDLTINGDIRKSVSTNELIQFGDGNTLSTNIIVNGNITRGANTGRFEVQVNGAEVTLNGQVDQVKNNDFRTIVQDAGTLTVSSTGAIGQGALTIREGGTVILNNDQFFDNNTTFGNATTGIGVDRLTIGATNTLSLDGNITYLADDDMDNTALISGGNVFMTGDRTITVNDNINGSLADPQAAELTISSDLSSNNGSAGNGNRTLVKNGTGTLLLSGASLAHGGIRVQNGIVKLQQDNAFSTTNRDLTVRSINSATEASTGSTFDLNGADASVRNIFLGHTSTDQQGGGANNFIVNTQQATEGGVLKVAGNITYYQGTTFEIPYDNQSPANFANNQTITSSSGGTAIIRGIFRVGNNAGASGVFSVEDVVGTFLDNDVITQGGNTADVNGTSMAVNKRNAMATISANLQLINSNSTFNIGDGSDAVDVLISGNIDSDNNLRIITKSGEGRLRLEGTQNNFGELIINQGAVEVSNTGAVGNSDITLGGGANNGIFEYTGAAGSIYNQFRVGANTGGAGITGGGTIINSGTGALTLSSLNTFNQARGNSNIGRTVTFEGAASDGTQDIIVSGGVIDNDTADGGTVGVIKNGANTVRLLGDNTYTGGTTINGGLLEISGNIGGDITIAAGANIAGEAMTTGTITFSGTTHTLDVDGSTSEALGTTGSLDLTNVAGGGFTINITDAGPGAFNVLTYGTAVGFSDISKFTLGTTPPAGPRGAGAGLAFTANAITYDAGFGDRIWNGTDGSSPGIWDEGLASSQNWQGGDMRFVNLDGVTFNDSAATGGGTGDVTVTLSANVNPTTISFTNQTRGYTISAPGSNIITIGNGGLSKTGDGASSDVLIEAELAGSGMIVVGSTTPTAGTDHGQLTLSGNNANFTGVTEVRQGDLVIGHINALGDDASNTLTLLDYGDDGRAILSAEGTFANNVVVSNQGGTKTFLFDFLSGGNNDARAATLSGGITMQEDSNGFNLQTEGRTENGDYGGTTSGSTKRTTHVLTVTGKITSEFDHDGAITKTDNGTLYLSNDTNDYTGQTHVNAGTLYFNTIGNVGESSALGKSSTRHTFDIRLGQNNNNAVMVYEGSGSSSDRQFQIGRRQNRNNNNTGGGTIANNGSGGLLFTNATFNIPETDGDALVADVGARTLVLAGQYTGTNEIQGVIQDNNTDSMTFVDETVGVTVDTNGTWALGGANTYTGATTVEAGTLLVNGSLAAGSAVTVNTGGILGGSGTINGATVINTGGRHTAGTDGGAGAQTLSATTTTYNSGSTVAWDLVANSNTNPGIDFDQFTIQSGGTLSFAATTDLRINFNDPSSSVDFTKWTEGGFWGTDKDWIVYTGDQTIDITNLALVNDPTNWIDSNGLDFDSSEIGQAGGSFGLLLGAGDTSVILRYTSAVPEPGSLSLLGIGIVAFGWIFRRRQVRRTNP